MLIEFDLGASEVPALASSHNMGLAIVSLMIALFASYAAVGASDRICVVKKKNSRRLWLVSGTVVMGIGIWSTHFVGMLAYSLPIPLSFDAVLTAMSIAPAVLASGIVLHFISKPVVEGHFPIILGIVMGIGICLMHYTGMAAINLNAVMTYDPFLFGLSIISAVVLSVFALRDKARTFQEGQSLVHWSKWRTAALLASAVGSAHYIGMAAVAFYPAEGRWDPRDTLDPVVLATQVAVGSAVVLGLAIFVTIVDRRLEAARKYSEQLEATIAERTEELRANEARLQSFINTAVDAIVVIGEDNQIVEFSPAAEQLFQYQRHEAIGQSVHLIIPDKFRVAHDAGMRKLLSTGTSKVIGGQVEVEARKKDGQIIPVDLSIGSSTINGEKYFIGVIRDVSDLKRAHNLIQESIDYASDIQRSSLPSDKKFEDLFSDHFVIWQSCEKVGGDFYAYSSWGDGELVALADCTGHGVPGAFMTLVAWDALKQAITQRDPGDCGGLIQRTHQIVQEMLGQDSRESISDDGLEIGVCYFPKDKRVLHYAGANISLFIHEDDNIEEIKGDKSEIGYRRIPYEKEFTTHQLETGRGRFFYMTSDGLPTQVGSEKRLPFGNKRFVRLLSSLGDLPMKDKKARILDALATHMGEAPQRDDVSLIGFEVTP